MLSLLPLNKNGAVAIVGSFVVVVVVGGGDIVIVVVVVSGVVDDVVVLVCLFVRSFVCLLFS